MSSSGGERADRGGARYVHRDESHHHSLNRRHRNLLNGANLLGGQLA
jgi:hypothetical protein